MYKIIIPKATFKELERIDPVNQKLVYAKIKDLEQGLFAADKPLKGKHKGKFTKRAGNYRIIYPKENDILVITLVRIAHRKEIYQVIASRNLLDTSFPKKSADNNHFMSPDHSLDE